MDDLISRQAAIDALKNRQDDGKGDISRFYNTIIQHDIEAIEQLPPAQPEQLGTNLAEVGTDCISRQAAIKILHEALDAADQIADVPFGVYQNYRDKMNELPPAQPEHIRGHWIRDRSWSEGAGMGESYGHYWKCDKCGHLEQGDWGECGCNFCSNCGSDNREVTT